MAVTADPPPKEIKPPYELQLTDEETEKADKLMALVAKAEKEDHYQAAAIAAEALLRLRESSAQGKDHWETVDQRWNVDSLKKVAALSAERRAWWREKPDRMKKAREGERMGDFVKAALFWKEWVEWCRTVFGDEHPETARSCLNLAFNLHARGQYEDAERWFRLAYQVRLRVLKEDHPDTAKSASNLASNLEASGKYAEVEQLFQKALDIRRKVLGDKHPETANSYHNLASYLKARARYADAEPLFEQARTIYQEAYGDDAPETAKSDSSLADNLNAQGRYADAEERLKKVYEVRQGALGDCDPEETAISCKRLAWSLLGQKKYAAAQPQLERAILAYEFARPWVRDQHERSEFGSDTRPYQLLAVVHARLRHPAPAWAAAETAAAHWLLEQSGAAAGNDLTQEEEGERAQLAGNLRKIQFRLDDLRRQKELSPEGAKDRADLRAKWDSLNRKLSDIAVATKRRRVAGLEAVRAALPPATALVMWVDVADASGGVTEHWGCVVRASAEPAWESLPGTGRNLAWTADDTALPGRLRRALGGDRDAAPAPGYEVARLARDLHSQRLAPLEKHLAEVKHLVVVPTGAMAAIPVEVLTEKFTVSYTPSGTFLARLKDRLTPAADGVLALGDPKYPPLPTRVFPIPPPAGGVLVKQVVPQGPAARAGIKSGDVLLTYAGKELTSADEFKESVVRQPVGLDVPVTVWREGEEQTTVKYVQPGRLGVILNSRPAPELAGLETLFGMKATSLTGTQASRTRLEELKAGGTLGGFRYLHLAAQVEMNNHRVFESALILAGDQKDRLPAAVLAEWKLNADLVTLSAGEIGLGQHGSGDGLLGFAQAFLHAGSRAVCLSLWKVDDTARCLLLDRFYRNLLGKRDGLDKSMGKAAALAEAKRWLRELSGDEAWRRLATLTQGVEGGPNARPPEQAGLGAPKTTEGTDRPFTHPRHWAGFILIGDPN
jgi:tetratricopeptide (TPR) repeat protein